MAASRSETPRIVAADLPASERGAVGRQRLVAVGGILGAFAASSCCLVPLVLFGLGIGGAWISNLTALAPYKPLFVTGTAGLLGYGFYLVYWKPRRICTDGAARLRTSYLQPHGSARALDCDGDRRGRLRLRLHRSAAAWRLRPGGDDV